MILRERQDRIVSALRSGGAASVRDLATSLQVSESTIRRDLDLLDRNGELTRTYGGAVLRPGATVTDSGDPLQRERPFAADAGLELKQRVADRFGVSLRPEPIFVGFKDDPDVTYLTEKPCPHF